VKPPITLGTFLNFWKKNEREADVPAGPPRPAGPSSWNDDLDLTLKSLLSDKESKSYGTVQAITLSDFRDSIGELWDRHQDKVLLIADTTIERMLDKGQTAIRQDEETWLLVTPDLTPAAAESFAKTIATTIGEKLIGSRFEETEDVDPTPQTGLIDFSETLNEDGSINRDAMRHAVQAAKAVIAARAGREKQRRSREHHKTSKGESAQENKPESPSGTSKQAVREEQITLKFHPAWSADSQAIDTFVCRPVSSTEGDPYLRENPLQVAANALAVMRAATIALQGLIQDSLRAKLVVPVPLSAVLSPAQNKIVNTLMKLEESHRFLYLRPEIVNVPAKTPPKDVLTARDIMMPVGRGIAVTTNLMEPNRAVMAAGKVILGFQAPQNGNVTYGDLEEALRRVHHTAGNRSTCVLGLPDRKIIAAAASIGFDEIGGKGLSPVLTERPKATSPLSRSQILAPLTEQPPSD
jgi:GGDEF domain-containing protein